MKIMKRNRLKDEVVDRGKSGGTGPKCPNHPIAHRTVSGTTSIRPRKCDPSLSVEQHTT